MPALSEVYSENANVAPGQPLVQSMTDAVDDNSIFIDPDKWFKEQREELVAENARVWKDQVLLWEMILLFIEGKQILRRAKYGSGWRAVPLPDRTDSPVYSLNLVGFYSKNIKAKWAQSSTDIVWRPVSDHDQVIGSAKAATTIHEYYARKLYTESFKQEESTLAQCGKYARYYYYTKDVKSYGRRPKVESVPVQFGESNWFCPECGASGDGDEIGVGELNPMSQVPLDGNSMGMGASDDVGGYGGSGRDEQVSGIEGLSPQSAGVCSQCGSPNLDIQQPGVAETETVTGYEDIEMGDIVCESVPAFELKHDLRFSPQDSPYLIRSRRMRTTILQSRFKFLKLQSSQKNAMPGLAAVDDLKRSTYASSTRNRIGSEDESSEKTVDYTQLWLDPAMYDRFVLKDAYRTLDGNEIPAQTKLIDLFPDGLYCCWLSSQDGMIELRNEHHKDFWVGQVYTMRAISSLGSGLEDMIEGNRQYNLVMSLIYTQLRTTATPATLYDETLLPNGVAAYLGNPLKNIPVNTLRLEGKSIRDAVHQLSPQPPTPQHFSYSQQLDYFMQKASCVTDFSGGLPGVNNSTATGAQIASANSQSLFAPQLALKADVDRRGAEIILALFRKYMFDEVWIAISGKRSKQDGIWLSASDVSVDLFAEVVPESFLPQTNLERRERFERLLMNLGGMPGLKMAMDQMPGLLEQLTETYDVDLGAEDYTAAAETARERLDQMKQALPMLQIQMQQMPPTQMQVDPMTGVALEVPVDPMAEAGQMLLQILTPPIEAEELGHLAAINWYRDWLTTDEGKEAPQELRAGVKAAIAAHIQGMMAEAQITGAVGMAGQPMPPAPPMPPGGEGGSREKPKNQTPDAKQSNNVKQPRPEQMGVMA